jgi:hypothetical protein
MHAHHIDPVQYAHAHRDTAQSRSPPRFLGEQANKTNDPICISIMPHLPPSLVQPGGGGGMHALDGADAGHSRSSQLARKGHPSKST